MMARSKVILLASFLLTFAAGTSLGLLISWPRSQPSRRSRLWRELNLSEEQRNQMREIWSEVMGSRRENRRALVWERDEAIVALLTDEQRPQYEQIVQEYKRKTDELSQERQRRIQEAVERTKQILTPEQAGKYEELRKQRTERGRNRRDIGNNRAGNRAAPDSQE